MRAKARSYSDLDNAVISAAKKTFLNFYRSAKKETPCGFFMSARALRTSCRCFVQELKRQDKCIRFCAVSAEFRLQQV